MPDRVFGSMDVSGDLVVGNHKYLGVFMATQDGIGTIFRQLRRMNIRIDDLKRKRRRRDTADGIDFDGGECVAFCARIDRDPIIRRTKRMRRLKKTSEGKIRKTYHNVLFHTLKDKMEDFSLAHGAALAEVRFQCDSDCMNFIRDAGLMSDSEGDAHAIADNIAWANNAGIEPRGTRPLDLVSELEDILVRRLTGQNTGPHSRRPKVR